MSAVVSRQGERRRVPRFHPPSRDREETLFFSFSSFSYSIPSDDKHAPPPRLAREAALPADGGHGFAGEQRERRQRACGLPREEVERVEGGGAVSLLLFFFILSFRQLEDDHGVRGEPRGGAFAEEAEALERGRGEVDVAVVAVAVAFARFAPPSLSLSTSRASSKRGGRRSRRRRKASGF